MAIDKMILDPTLDTYRNMLKDLQNQNIVGEDMDKMAEIISKMEDLGNELSDINEFFGIIMQEDLFGKFSAHYTKALTNQYQAGSSENGKNYNDTLILKQAIDALKNAIITIKEAYNKAIEDAKNFSIEDQVENSVNYYAKNLGKRQKNRILESANKELQTSLKESPNAYDNSIETAVLHDPELIIKGIQNLIDLGEQEGMTAPKFYRLQIERGLDKAMEGSVVVRKGLEFELDFILANPTSKFQVQKAKEKLEVFDELAAKNKFNIPNLKELEYAHLDIDYKFEKDILIWENITKRWEDMLSDLNLWSLAYSGFATEIEPWKIMPNPRQAVIEAQKTIPGIFKQKEKLLKKYFGLSFMDIFSHPSFEWSVNYNQISLSQEFTEFLIEKVYPDCKPFNNLSAELIKERESFYPIYNKPDKEINPEISMPAKRIRDYYDSTYGEGRYKSKFGEIQEVESGAKPWKFETFKFK